MLCKKTTVTILAAIFALGLSMGSAWAQVDEVIATDASRIPRDVDFGEWSQTPHRGVIAAWQHNDPAQASVINFHRFSDGTFVWELEQIGAINDVLTSPTDGATTYTVRETTKAIQIAAGDYRPDGLLDVTAMYNSGGAETSLITYQRTAAGFSAGDTSMSNVNSESAGGETGHYWQNIYIGDIVGDGVDTLVTSQLRVLGGELQFSGIPSLAYGEQWVTLHRRTPGGRVSDMEAGRTASEAAPIVVGDITGDGNLDLAHVENFWNRSPGWGHQFNIYAQSNNGGDAGGSFEAGNNADRFDDASVAGNALPVGNVATSNGGFYTQQLWANAEGGFPVTAMTSGDVTNDGIPEVICALGDYLGGSAYGGHIVTDETNGWGGLRLLQLSSAGPMPTNPAMTADMEDFGNMFWWELVTGDVNGDGQDDLVAVAEDTSTGEWHLFLYDWDKGGFVSGDGAASASWPTSGSFVPPDSGSLLNSATRTDLIAASATEITCLGVGNADGDADLEIVYGLANGELHIIDLVGELSAVPVEISEFTLE